MSKRRRACALPDLTVVGAAGWGNAGDDLISIRLAEWSRGRSRRMTFVGGPEIGNIPELGHDTIVLDGSLRRRWALLRSIWRSDWVIIGGGGLLDDRAASFYRPFTRVAQFCRMLTTPYSFVGVGVGPIRTSKAVREYRKAGNGAVSILTRDIESSDRLVDVGVCPELISAAGDPVAWKREAAEQRSPNASYDLCINLRGWEGLAKSEFEDDVSTEDIAPVLAAGIGRVFGPTARVVMLSMSNRDGDNDALAMEDLRRSLHRTCTLVDFAEPADAIRAIDNSATVISMRLHGCLIAASLGKPVIGLAYDPKLAQQGTSIGFPTLRLLEAINPNTIEMALREMALQNVRTGEPAYGLHCPPPVPWQQFP